MNYNSDSQHFITEAKALQVYRTLDVHCAVLFFFFNGSTALA